MLSSTIMYLFTAWTFAAIVLAQNLSPEVRMTALRPLRFKLATPNATKSPQDSDR